MPKLFDEILLQGIRAGQAPARTSTAREWYRNKAKSLGKVNERVVMKDSSNVFSNSFAIGSMYHFYYDPKHKDTLPYYDRFPLMIPIAPSKNGYVTGLNLHYLPPPLRAKLFDALYEVTNNSKYDDTTKLKLNYRTLQSAAKFRYFEPTIKTYLLSHVRSRLLKIHSTEWDIALWLDTTRFEKATKTEVWDDSKRIIRGF